MTYFRTRRKDDGMYLATSEEGLVWRSLGEMPVLSPHPDADYIADPFYLRGVDGTFHIVYTASWGRFPGEAASSLHRTFGYASTKDFVDWPDHRLISVDDGPTKDARNVWAPKLFYDHRTDEYIVLFSSACRELPGLQTLFKGDHAIFSVRTRDFFEFSEPSRFFAGAFCDRALIDCFLMSHEQTYHAFVKVEADDLAGAGKKRGIHHCTAMSLDGPWSELRPVTGAGGRTEGPFVLRRNDRGTDSGHSWLLFGDAPYFVAESDDLMSWHPITEQLVYPPGYTHGTAAWVPLLSGRPAVDF